MPKTAAAILGFALMIGAIGFNTTRYPVVWKMVGPAGQATPASETTPSPTVTPSPTPTCPPPATLEKALAQTAAAPNSETEPAPKLTAKTMSDTAPPPKTTPPKQPAMEPDVDQASTVETPAAEESPKPLVPVLPPSAPTDAIGGSDSAERIRRLPPVNRRGAGLDGSDTARLFAGSSPAYPSTSTP